MSHSLKMQGHMEVSEETDITKLAKVIMKCHCITFCLPIILLATDQKNSVFRVSLTLHF